MVVAFLAAVSGTSNFTANAQVFSRIDPTFDLMYSKHSRQQWRVTSSFLRDVLGNL